MAIQGAINSALTGTAFLLSQSPAYKEKAAESYANQAGEKQLKELEAVKNARIENANKQIDQVADIAVKQANREYNESVAETKRNTPKYRTQQLVEDNSGKAFDNWLNTLEPDDGSYDAWLDNQLQLADSEKAATVKATKRLTSKTKSKIEQAERNKRLQEAIKNRPAKFNNLEVIK